MGQTATEIINVTVQPAEAMRQATDVAGVCREIVMRTAQKIQGRKFVRVEGWQAIATAHGCMLSIENVTEDADGNVTAIASVRRIVDGVELGRAEGFLGSDEKTWNSRPRYARRAMAQTRAMSRAARSAFAHVVVLIDAGLSTTPAEEADPARGEGDGEQADKPDEYADASNFRDAVRAECLKRQINTADADAGLETVRLNMGYETLDAMPTPTREAIIAGIRNGRSDKWKGLSTQGTQGGPITDEQIRHDETDRPEITASELAVKSDSDFQKLIYLAAYDDSLTVRQVQTGIQQFAHNKKKSVKSLNGAERLELFNAVEAKAFDWETGAVREAATA